MLIYNLSRGLGCLSSFEFNRSGQSSTRTSIRTPHQKVQDASAVDKDDHFSERSLADRNYDTSYYKVLSP